ncbi:hypothetical protein BGZ92_004905, partial [Podila epicladia]
MTDDSLTLFCLIDGESLSTAFEVEIASAKTISTLKNLIVDGNQAPAFREIAAKVLILWLVSIPDDKQGSPVMIDALDDKIELNNPRTQLSKLFPESPDDNTYIIVQRPPPVHAPVPARSSSPRLSHLSAQPRPGSPLSAPVVGKTRYGRELYDALRRQLSPAAKENGLDYSPHYYYMLLEFGNRVELGPAEASLDAETILGLRLVYAHFFQGKYRERFSDFCYRAVGYRGLFTISSVIIAIRKDLKLPENQPLFLFLHIDEFQMIFDHRWQGTPKGHWPASLTDTGIRLTGDKTECHTR